MKNISSNGIKHWGMTQMRFFANKSKGPSGISVQINIKYYFYIQSVNSKMVDKEASLVGRRDCRKGLQFRLTTRSTPDRSVIRSLGKTRDY